jgi:thioredoxin 1|tara:strand:+ start:40067 stop:40393 length:327 start_codon:yes stop_codon:yes gene_type:complete
MSDLMKQVTDADFQSEVLEAEGPVLVDFWAAWCGPCKMIAPILEEMAAEYGDQLKICKMDVDASRETPMKYNVRGIPTLIIFKGGDVDSMKVGAVSRNQLKEFIDAAV